MKITWPVIAFIVTIFLGVLTFTFTNVLADQSNKNDQFNMKFDKIQDQILDISKNVALVAGQLRNIDLPNMNATLQSVEGRASRIEKLLEIQ